MLDDKIVSAWNGLTLSALAKVVEYPYFTSDVHDRARRLAKETINFLRTKSFTATSGELCRSWRQGQGPRGQLEDYAFVIRGLIDCFESFGDEPALMWALDLQKSQDKLFWDVKDGGYFCSPEGDASVIVSLSVTLDISG